ncbi:MAG: hypothetical protein GYB41_00690 [Oceanospirillales bacterium]|nr:hypothetical protein [Oceanospirillales bacterium]
MDILKWLLIRFPSALLSAPLRCSLLRISFRGFYRLSLCCITLFISQNSFADQSFRLVCNNPYGSNKVFTGLPESITEQCAKWSRDQIPQHDGQAIGGHTKNLVISSVQCSSEVLNAQSGTCSVSGNIDLFSGRYQKWVADTFNASYFMTTLQCPESGTPASFTVKKYSAQSTLGISYNLDGCAVEPVEWTCSEPDESGIQTCVVDGVYNGESGESSPDPEDPGAPPEPEPDTKECYYDDGRYAGTVSSNASCPEGSAPDDDGDGKPDDGGGGEEEPCDPAVEQCPVDPEPPEPCDPAVEECPDTGDADGVNDQGVSCEEGKAPICTSADPFKCFEIKQRWQEMCGKLETLNSDCHQPFQCSGSVINCYLAEKQYNYACAFYDDDEMSSAVSDAISAGYLPEGKLDEYGQLDGLDSGEVNIAQSFNVSSMWQDSGSSGSCPAPIQRTIAGFNIDFSFQPLCDLAGLIRGFVIFMATWLSANMLSQVLLGTRWR